MAPATGMVTVFNAEVFDYFSGIIDTVFEANSAVVLSLAVALGNASLPIAVWLGVLA